MPATNTAVSRRGFLVGSAAVAAGVATTGAIVQTALPWGTERVAGTMDTAPGTDDVIAAARRWYEAKVDAVTRGWEQRFRHRQYRPDVDGDWEDEIEAPRNELEHVLGPVIGGSAAIVLMARPEAEDELGDDAGTLTLAAGIMALDVLAHAERLGYFAEPCPEAFRFPDLPAGGYMVDDMQATERELETARSCAHGWAGIVELETARGHVAPDAVAKRDEFRARVPVLEARLADMRAGKVPALSEAEKIAAHVANRNAIVLAYRERLAAMGRDVSWIELPPYWGAEREVA